MKENLKVYIERLQGSKTQKIDEILNASEISLQDDGLKFKDPIHVEGDAYVTDEWLIVQLHIHTQVIIPCALCNEAMTLELSCANFIEEIPLDEIRGQVYDLAALIREAILLEIPFYPQCGGTSCLNRDKIEKYLSKESKSKKGKKEETHNPFRDLL